MDFDKYIAQVRDFPKKGILFYDITPLLLNPGAYAQACDALAERVGEYNPQAIVSPEARGFFFGIPVAMRLGVPFLPIRKKGKLPRQTLEAKYDLEYGSDALYVHKDDIKVFKHIAVVDDILATGGTAKAMCSLAESLGNEVACCAFLMELEFLNGRSELENKNVISLISPK